MNRIINVFLVTLVIVGSIVGPAIGQEKMTKPKTAYEEFLSNKGTLIVKDFTELSPLNSQYKVLEAKVVRLEATGQVKHFLSLSAEAKYGDKSASIVKEDLLEVQKALVTIIAKYQEEESVSRPYRERFFVTNDGFKLGYFQNGTDFTIFIDLDDYQSEDTYFFNSFGALESLIVHALEKMVG